MLQEERFSNIIEFLKTNNTAAVHDLAKLNKVSVDTVRRDLDILESYGVLERVRGGAVWRRESLEQHVYEMRVMVHSEEKSQLAGLIDQVLEDGTTVAIGSGSTTVEIAKHIAAKYKKMTVITNDLDIVKILSHKEGFKIILLGGLFDKEENATYGEPCEEEIGQYNADVGILSVNSISLEKGFCDFRLNQMDTFRQIIEISDKVVIAADSSKFEKSACMTLCGIEKADIILSDDKLQEEKKKMYREKGIEILTP